MAHKITNAKFVQKKSKSHAVTPLGDNRYNVTSGTSGNLYTVIIVSGQWARCDCTWAQYRPNSDMRCGCSHAVAVFNHIEEQNNNKRVSVWTSEEDARRQHKSQKDVGDGVILTLRLAN